MQIQERKSIACSFIYISNICNFVLQKLCEEEQGIGIYPDGMYWMDGESTRREGGGKEGGEEGYVAYMFL